MPERPVAPDPLWTVDEAAPFLRKSRKAIYADVEAGRLPCIRLGRSIRFRASDLNAWLDKLAEGGR